MATSFRGNLYRRPDFAIMGTDIPERLRRPRPPWTDNPPIVPPADPNNPFGDPPRFHEVDPPEQNPYNDPVYRPFIVTENLSGQTDGEPVGGWPGMLLRATMQQGQVQPRTDSVSMPNDASEHNSDSHGNLQDGLLGRLLSLQAEQSQYQPTSGDNDQAPFVSPDPNFRQLARIPNTVQPMPLPPQPEASASHMQAQDEADQAQQARDAAAARLVRGVRSVHRAEGPEPDPIDIAKSAGIGLVNGGVNLVGLLPDIFGAFGSDHLKPWRSEELRQWMGGANGFYQPKSRVGRFAETIGEMVPALLAGEGFGVAVDGQAAALRELPRALMKHTVAPGIAVQTLQEALPDSKAGPTLQKAYPVVRRGLPIALAATRYLGRRIVPQ